MPSPPVAVVRSSCPQTSTPFPTSVPSLASAPRQLQPNQSCLRFFQVQHLFPTRLALLQHRLNMHKCLPTGGSLQTAVSDAPRQRSLPAHSSLFWGASDTALTFLDSFRRRNRKGDGLVLDMSVCPTYQASGLLSRTSQLDCRGYPMLKSTELATGEFHWRRIVFRRWRPQLPYNAASHCSYGKTNPSDSCDLDPYPAEII